jgi:uncharacterized protein (DUF697 family)
MKKLTEEKIKQILEFVYQKVLQEINNSNFDEKCIYEHCHIIIKKHKYKAGFYGFLTGIGGLFWIPLTLPTNITLILYLQVKMVASIAHIAGYDLEDEEVKLMIFACLTGDNVYNILKDIGINIDKNIVTHVRKHISQKTIKQIQRKIIFKLLAKLGEKGLLSFTKIIPIISGIIGGSNDLLHTHQIGEIAKKIFIKREKA